MLEEEFMRWKRLLNYLIWSPLIYFLGESACILGNYTERAKSILALW